jgi:hypothetical protein
MELFTVSLPISVILANDRPRSYQYPCKGRANRVGRGTCRIMHQASQQCTTTNSNYAAPAHPLED